MQTQETTFERHYSVDELASIWGVSDDFVRRLFLHEPGVVVFFKHRPGKRVYRVHESSGVGREACASTHGARPRWQIVAGKLLMFVGVPSAAHMYQC